MKPILVILALSLFPFFVGAKEIESIWISVSGESQRIEDPWRIIIYDDSSVLSQKFFFGCKREFGSELEIVDDIIEIKVPDRDSIIIRKEENKLVCTRKFRDEEYDLVFSENEEWNKKFEDAPYPPRNRKEALEVLDIILDDENKNVLREMKEEDLIMLHHGFGTGLRNGFGLWNPESQIAKDYGGGHPDDISMKLIEDYWGKLQKTNPNRPKVATP